MQDNDNPIVRKKRYRSNNGQPRPYKDGARWKAPAYVILSTGGKVKVIGTGKTRAEAESRRDQLIEKRKGEIKVANKDLSKIAPYCQHWLENVKGSDIRYKTRKYCSGTFPMLSRTMRFCLQCLSLLVLALP